jgi:AraC family transcriptional activator of pobA
MAAQHPIPVWQLYGENSPFPDLLHIERIVDRAAGLDWTIEPHRHAHLHQIFYLKSGDVAFQVDGRTLHPATPVTLNLPPGSVHGFSFSAGTEGYVLTLPVRDHPAIFAADSRTGPAAAQVLVCAAPEGSELRFETLMRDWSRRGPFREIELRAQVALILCSLLAAAPDGAGPAAADPRFSRFEALIHAHLREHWPLERFARQLNLSVRHLNRICQATAGQSASACIEAQMIHEACRLLAYTRMTVQQVAWQLGFADPSYFSRAFRRRVGRSPQDYRRDFGG